MKTGDKGNSGCKVVGIACLLATLVVLSPIGILFWVMQKGYHDARSAQDEFKRTVNPDELRAWVFSQLQKHPEGGYYSVEAAADWPKALPHFAASRRSSVYLYPSQENQRARDTIGASLAWDFSGGYGLKVTIFLNPDGTPADVDDRPPWAKGISFNFLAK